MRKSWKHLDGWRGQYDQRFASPNGARYGAFTIPHNGYHLRIIASDEIGNDTVSCGWEHVSVHAYDPQFDKQRTPRWDEMCFVKDLFWEEDEAVIQIHPPKIDYVNTHDFVLHLWRPTKEKIPMPPKICV